MSTMVRAEGTLREARRRLERGEVPAGLVDDLIARSWQRCLQAGCAPSGRADAPQLSSSELAHATERLHGLLATAAPVLQHVHAQIRDSGSMVILADERGMLLSALGDPAFVSRAERVALTPGASWLEAHRGTNAIGTTVAEAQAVVVHGGEHFLARNAFLTCAAAPIRGSAGRLVGVVDISGDSRGRPSHTFGLVRTAAQMIENRLFDERHARQLRLRMHPMAQGIGTVAEGLVALDDEGAVTGGNAAGLAMLGLDFADVGVATRRRFFDVRLTDIIDWSRRHAGRPLAVRRSDGTVLFVRADWSRRPAAPAMARDAAATSRHDALAVLDTGDARYAAAIARARRIVDKPIAVLLQGETGVGKEVFARAMHASSLRRAGPFVSVDCASLPEGLIESELFGYAPGAYTGARRDGAPGRVREAHGGTLFLDEIGDMPLGMQSRLLRVLQERRVTPLGGGRPVDVDFTLVCATHRRLKDEVAAGRFRADLYYRINGLTLSLPPLRERGDLETVVGRVLRDASPDQLVDLDPAVADAMTRYAWPGNLRQLSSVLRTACALLEPGEQRITWQHLGDDVADDLTRASTQEPPTESAADNLRVLADAVVMRAVDRAAGNMSAAARRLGISRNTLYRRLRRVASGA